MGNDNISTLHVQKKPEPVPRVVEELEKMLEEAKSGQIRGLVCGYIFEKEGKIYHAVFNENIEETLALGLTVRLQHYLGAQTEAAYRE